MLLNPLMFNCRCSVCVPLLLPELVCTLSLQRFLLEDCSTAPAAATVLSLALAALLELVPDCLRQLFLLRGRLCLVVQILLHLNICAVAMASYVCQSSVLCYHVKRSFSRIPTASGEHHKITVCRMRTNRDVDNIGRETSFRSFLLVEFLHLSWERYALSSAGDAGHRHFNLVS